MKLLSHTARASLCAAAIAFAALFFAMLHASPHALAGTTGTLTGVAVDAASNAPLAGAKVVASAPSALESTVTDKKGRFTFASLPPDTYSVALEAPGYAPARLVGIEIVADNVLDVTLSASAVH